MDSSSTPIKFDIYAGEQIVRTEILTGPTIKIGKLTSLSLRLDDDSVSRLHAQIEIKHPDDVVLLDLGSERGTFVNGERVTRTRLRTGDSIMFGELKVMVTIAGQSIEKTQRRPAQVVQQNPILDDYVDMGAGRVLEVLALLGSCVIDVTHLKGEGQYTVGFTDDVNCFIEAKSVPCDPFPLAEIKSGDMMMVHIPDHVEGEVMLDGKIFNLQGLREANRLRPGPVRGCSTLSLPFKARCRLRLGEFTFLVNAVPAAKAPPPIKLSERIDPHLIFSILSVSLLSMCIWILIGLIPASPESLALDRLDSLNKFIEITLDAEEKIEKKKESGGDKGAKKAAKSEGKMGKKDEIQDNKKYQIKGTDTGDPEVVRARKQAIAQQTAEEIFAAMDSGLLDGSESAVALGALEGFNGNHNGEMAGNSFGVGGLGSVGTGLGGGGDSMGSFGLGGLSTVGGGGGRGGGKGYGSGAANVGRRKARRPKVIAMTAKVDSGNLPKEVIRRVIMSRAGAYQNCYEKELASKKDLNGKIEVKIMISGTGKVLLAGVNSTTMNNPRVQNCIVKQIKKLRFPAPKNGKNVKVRYPFRFKSGG